MYRNAISKMNQDQKKNTRRQEEGMKKKNRLSNKFLWNPFVDFCFTLVQIESKANEFILFFSYFVFYLIVNRVFFCFKERKKKKTNKKQTENKFIFDYSFFFALLLQELWKYTFYNQNNLNSMSFFSIVLCILSFLFLIFFY